MRERGEGDFLPEVRKPNGLEILRGIFRVGGRKRKMPHGTGDLRSVLGHGASDGHEAKCEVSGGFNRWEETPLKPLLRVLGYLALCLLFTLLLVLSALAGNGR